MHGVEDINALWSFLLRRAFVFMKGDCEEVL